MTYTIILDEMSVNEKASKLSDPITMYTLNAACRQIQISLPFVPIDFYRGKKVL